MILTAAFLLLPTASCWLGTTRIGWGEFEKRVKRKTAEGMKDYGVLFLKHITEELTDSPTFSDGVPKEELTIEDVLVRLGTLTLFRDKVRLYVSEKRDACLKSHRS